METPRDFKKKINDGIVTRDMLLNVIFAFNKRAKIYKDKEKNIAINIMMVIIIEKNTRD